MRPKKKSLSLKRETIRQLDTPALSEVNGALRNISAGCGTLPQPTQRHSCFDSCYDTDCCLMIP